MILEDYLKQFEGLDPKMEVGILYKDSEDSMEQMDLNIKVSIKYSYSYGLENLTLPYVSDIENSNVPGEYNGLSYTFDKKVICVGCIVAEDIFS